MINPDLLRRTDKRWWRFAVLRGPGLPSELDGRWYDLEAEAGWANLNQATAYGRAAELVPTNQWEQREDGQVAVVYRWNGR